MKFKVGDKVKIISKSNFNVFKIGEKLEVIKPCSGDGDYYYCRSLNGSSSVLQIIMERDLVLSNNRGKNKRGKDGRFIKEVNKEDVLNNHELRLRRIEQYLDLDK